MKAIRVHFTATESTLRMDEVPKPEPVADQIVIRAQAIGLNRADLGRRRMAQPGQPEQPATPGLDVAGSVEAVGAEVRGWRRGDQVMALVRGAYAEYVATRAVTAYHPPRGMRMTDAASLPCVFLTAYYALTKLAGLKRGETVLIHAAGSGVGMAGIQIAHALGARVLTSAGSDERVARGRQLGAEAGVNYSSQDVTMELNRLTGGRGVNVVLDSVGGSIFDATLKALAPGGRIVTVGGPAGPRTAYDEGALTAKGQWVKPMTVFAEAQADTEQKGWAQLKAWFESGTLRTVVQQVMPWTQAEAAQKLLTDRGVFGKIVMTVG
ncbi:MAG: zinc-binding dehydrogenase [Chloroflexi bacterium]|nr:zinc-binding dehydrogenase [Chloroflexota bacterium]